MEDNRNILSQTVLCMTKACGILENSSENCREEEYMTNSRFTSNVDYMTPNMAIMKLKQQNLKMVYPTMFVYDTLPQVQS